MNDRYSHFGMCIFSYHSPAFQLIQVLYHICFDLSTIKRGISKKYLELVLKVLVQNEILNCASGKNGGYKLTRKPSEYTVGEILELSEVPMSVVSCLQGENNSCERKSECLTLPMWEKFNQLTHDFFYGITLQDILDENQGLGARD